MRVFIDKPREERLIKAGWFKRVPVPEYKLFIAIELSEEERFLIKHTGIGNYVFFRAPIPPAMTTPTRSSACATRTSACSTSATSRHEPTHPDRRSARLHRGRRCGEGGQGQVDELQRYLERAAEDQGAQEYEP